MICIYSMLKGKHLNQAHGKLNLSLFNIKKFNLSAILKKIYVKGI